MSWADCDFAGDGQADYKHSNHGDCQKMCGHIGPHKDCAGNEWWTDVQKKLYWESLTEEQRQWHENYHDERFYHAEIGGKHLACHRNEQKAWASAAEFTRDRLEQIRQLAAEIALVQGDVDNLREHGLILIFPDWTLEYCRWSRILSRLESALADLKRGMRP